MTLVNVNTVSKSISLKSQDQSKNTLIIVTLWTKTWQA